ncbi:MAG: 3-oxoacyl-[acyl-carrier-protein] reductase [Anaerolineae bacterium]|nr:3-oxoacyl-[acyl-carrier-protein] reductase [Anaerolineae bacterium]
MKERVALVTGGSQGIGRAICEELSRRGATIIVNHYPSESDAEKAADTVKAIETAGGKAMALQADVTKSDQVDKMIKDALEAQGKIDILVNNAGITRDTLIMTMAEEDWDAVLTTNLKSAFLCSKAVVRSMMRQRYGRIVSMSSVSGIAGNPGQTNYSASKAGIIGFTKSLAREVAARNITVNAVAPGFIPTELTQDLPEELKQGSLGSIPLKRWGTPEEIAYAVAFLASDEAGYITGHILSVDGGMVMG